MHVISIQSQVVHGHVGNSAAVFPLLSKGLQVAAVPTALLSNHPHYPTMYGRVLEPDFLGGLLQGVEDRGLVEASAVLVTGYVGSVENALVIASFVERARALNPKLMYVCDPVMGDDDLGLFVKEDLVDVFRERLVPLAQVITPNQYELELLARRGARTVVDLETCLAKLSGNAPPLAAVTGCVFDDTIRGQVETVSCSASGFARSAVERLPIRPCGTGDLFTALLIAGLCDDKCLNEAAANATAEVFGVLQATLAAGSNEMLLTGFSASATLTQEVTHERV